MIRETGRTWSRPPEPAPGGRACRDRVFGGRACRDRVVGGRACRDRVVGGRACRDRVFGGRACRDRVIGGRACRDRAASTAEPRRPSVHTPAATSPAARRRASRRELLRQTAPLSGRAVHLHPRVRRRLVLRRQHLEGHRSTSRRAQRRRRLFVHATPAPGVPGLGRALRAHGRRLPTGEADPGLEPGKRRALIEGRFGDLPALAWNSQRKAREEGAREVPPDRGGR
jgi:hypothetical protein